MSLNNLYSINYNHIALNRHHQRNINRRYQRRFRHQRSNRHVLTDNTDTLDRIKKLPPQITNDPFANQMFNGSSFH